MHHTILETIKAAQAQTRFPQCYTVALAGFASFYDRHVPNLELDQDGEAARLVGTCPLCSKVKGFSADFLNGNWHCKGCEEMGLLDDFIRLTGKVSREEARAIADGIANEIIAIGNMAGGWD